MARTEAGLSGRLSFNDCAEFGTQIGVGLGAVGEGVAVVDDQKGVDGAPVLAGIDSGVDNVQGLTIERAGNLLKKPRPVRTVNQDFAAFWCMGPHRNQRLAAFVGQYFLTMPEQFVFGVTQEIGARKMSPEGARLRLVRTGDFSHDKMLFIGNELWEVLHLPLFPLKFTSRRPV